MREARVFACDPRDRLPVRCFPRRRCGVRPRSGLASSGGHGEFFDLIGEGGKEEQILSPLREERKDFADILDESHVQHAIRFVQDQKFDSGKIHSALSNMVQQAARRCDQDIDPCAELPDLGIDVDTAVDDGRIQRQMLSVGRHTLFDLSRKLSGWREDKGANAILSPCPGAFAQALQDRESKTGSFPVPVCAPASTSFPLRMTGIACR
jgi:hypothetical protein